MYSTCNCLKRLTLFRKVCRLPFKICLPSLCSVWFPPGGWWLARNWKTSTRRKEVRGREGSDGGRISGQRDINTNIQVLKKFFEITSFCVFHYKVLEQPKKASDRHTPAKHHALAYVFVTCWVTLRTFLWGEKKGDTDQTLMLIFIMWFMISILFQIQEPCSSVSVHVSSLDSWCWRPTEETQGKHLRPVTVCEELLKEVWNYPPIIHYIFTVDRQMHILQTVTRGSSGLRVLPEDTLALELG